MQGRTDCKREKKKAVTFGKMNCWLQWLRRERG